MLHPDGQPWIEELSGRFLKNGLLYRKKLWTITAEYKELLDLP
jgi:hypothetical protein